MNISRVVLTFVLASATMVSWSQKLTFCLPWLAQAQFAGYYVAQEKGFYKSAGVDVEFVYPSVSRAVVSQFLEDENRVFGLPLIQAVQLVDQGIPLINILQTSMNSSLVLVSRRNTEPIRQKGAKMGIWMSGIGDVLTLCLDKDIHLGYQFVRTASNVNLFITGAIDVALATSYNEYYQLKQTGMTLDAKNVFRFSDHGYNIQEDGVYVTRSFYQKRHKQLKRFAEASKKGWEWAAEHPDEAIDIVMKYVREEKTATNSVLQRLMLKEVLRLQLDPDTHKREFRLRPDMIRKASQLSLKCNVTSREVRYEDLVIKE